MLLHLAQQQIHSRSFLRRRVLTFFRHSSILFLASSHHLSKQSLFLSGHYSLCYSFLFLREENVAKRKTLNTLLLHHSFRSRLYIWVHTSNRYFYHAISYLPRRLFSFC